MEYIITLRLDEDELILLNQKSKVFADKNNIKPNRSNYIRHLIAKDKGE